MKDPNQIDVVPVHSTDPNEMIGPAAYGAQNFVSASAPLAYTIDFQNAATATAPAQSITITQQLDSNLDWRSFRLTGFGFDNLTTSLSGNSAFYSGLLDYSATMGYDVEVSAAVNVQTGVVTWNLQTIDPTTGVAPTNPELGLLPVEDAAGDGEGFVSYTIEANSTATTGTVVNAQAQVVFDTNGPINTATISDTLDAVAPTSAVQALPAQIANATFEVSWSGQDDAGGSGLASYTIFVSEDGGPQTAWLSDTTRTNALYTGQLGHSYSFSSVAIDNAGNQEAPHATAEATIEVGTVAPTNLALTAATDTGASQTDGITSDTTPIVSGVADPGASVTLYDGTNDVGTATADATTGAWSIQTPKLAEGAHTLTATAVNSTGDVSPASAPLTVTVETMLPTVTLSGASGAVAQAQQTLSGTVSATAAGQTVAIFDGATQVGTAKSDSSTGKWSAQVKLDAPGDNTLSAEVSDLAGNVGTSTTLVENLAVSVKDYLANQVALDSQADGVLILDSAKNVSGQFDALNADARIAAITLTDQGTPSLLLDAQQAIQDTVALGKITNAQFNIAVSDKADTVATYFDQLNGNSHVASITLTDAGTPVLDLTSAHAQNDAHALGEITNAAYEVVTPDAVAQLFFTNDETLTDLPSDAHSPAKIGLNGHILTFDPPSGSTLDISADISDGGSKGGLVVNGGVRLDGQNTFSGGIFVKAGVLDLGGATAAGAGAITMAAGTTLEFASGGLTIVNNISIAGDPTFAVAIGQTETVSGVISDTVGSAPGVVEKTGGGTLVLDNANTYSGGTVIDGGTLELGNAEAAGTGAITFNGSNLALQIDVAQPQVKEIDGFAGSDVIQIKAFGAGDIESVSGQQVIITSSDGKSTETLTFGAGTQATAVQFGFNSATGEDTLTICFLAGTMIRTPDGEVAIETLRCGDMVLTSDGEARPLAWLGRQTVSARFADPIRSWPVRIKAGALGDNMPCRDLLVSPDHALLVGEVLIHAGALVNGTSIVRETAVPETFIYYHVELDDHSLILAENTPAETFIDNVDRMHFDNWDEHEALYPDGKPIEEMPYPRAKARRQVPMRIRAALEERANILDGGKVLAVA